MPPKKTLPAPVASVTPAAAIATSATTAATAIKKIVPLDGEKKKKAHVKKHYGLSGGIRKCLQKNHQFRHLQLPSGKKYVVKQEDGTKLVRKPKHKYPAIDVIEEMVLNEVTGKMLDCALAAAHAANRNKTLLLVDGLAAVHLRLHNKEDDQALRNECVNRIIPPIRLYKELYPTKKSEKKVKPAAPAPAPAPVAAAITTAADDFPVDD